MAKLTGNGRSTVVRESRGNVNARKELNRDRRARRPIFHVEVARIGELAVSRYTRKSLCRTKDNLKTGYHLRSPQPRVNDSSYRAFAPPVVTCVNGHGRTENNNNRKTKCNAETVANTDNGHWTMDCLNSSSVGNDSRING